MPEETRYVTLSGNVPNGGIPPGRMLYGIAGPPFLTIPGRHALSGPPSDGPHHNGNGLGHRPYYPTLHPGPPPPPIIAPAPAANPSPYEPPGQYMDGHMLRGDGWSYIMPSENTTIHFVGDSLRPCDFPNGYYPHRFDFTKHKVSSVMTVKDLIKQLGAPEGDENGITEMEEGGDNHFYAGATITQGSRMANQTLAEMGWSQRRSERAPIWIVVKY